MPRTAPAFYLIEAALTLSEREWNVRRYILVPEQRLEAELVPASDPRAVPDRFMFEIVNHSPTALLFGTPYELERWDGNAWVNCNVDSVWEASRLRVAPGASLKQTVLLPPSAAGRYRIAKIVRAVGTRLEATLLLEFELSGNRH